MSGAKRIAPGTRLPARRDVLRTAGIAAAAAAIPGASWAQDQSSGAVVRATLGDGLPFGPDAVKELARTLAKRPFSAPSTDLQAPFANLNYERYVGIQMRESDRIWAGVDLGFVVEPLTRGFVFTTPVALFTVEDGRVARIGFDRNRVDFGELNVPPNAPDPGFSGLRLYAREGRDATRLFGILQGATFMRAAAKDQTFGTIARALTINPAEQKGEEFPAFRALWIERPGQGSNALVIHGLIESESATGAVRMTFRPGDTTVVDVETTVFARVALEHIGMGGATASFFFGPNVRRDTDDLRVGAYDASGLSVLNGSGEWLWRPLNNPQTLQISAFVDDNPRGFGLLQRERDFAAFQDDQQRYETRPSLWIEPIGDWGPGAIQLIEIPSDAEINKNVLAYWRPKAPVPAGQEFGFAHRQLWAWAPPVRPTLAQVTATRSGQAGGKKRRFLVEFRGDQLGSVPPALKAAASASPGTVQNVRIWTYPERKSIRVSFELDPGNEGASELRLLLESESRPVSETWLYRWTA